MPKRSSKSTTTSPNERLVEVASEACNQVGVIHTINRSKAFCIMENLIDRFCIIGPLLKNLNRHYEEVYRTEL